MGPDGCGIKTREGDGYFELKRCALNLQNSQNHLVSMGNSERISSQDCKDYIILLESLQNPGSCIEIQPCLPARTSDSVKITSVSVR